MCRKSKESTKGRSDVNFSSIVIKLLDFTITIECINSGAPNLAIIAKLYAFRDSKVNCAFLPPHSYSNKYLI